MGGCLIMAGLVWLLEGKDYFESLDEPVLASKHSSNLGSGRVFENDRGWSTSRRSQGSSLDAAVPQPVRMQRICIKRAA
ncbi:hypothetical protein B0J15DRAFT_493971 [Fusarium solani]|uniref:Uncharacterized protein n=1 Tax=Fusarium solani TaxID=169388 RepID=A0A9P9HJ37_FUSSL|nr:uncharacterized protein B0J15DRAFT_493971 [Fusarium solani]KAH7258535.1 hypothetical protein B0J15DRAFT_493971 [Fusarium solani]